MADQHNSDDAPLNAGASAVTDDVTGFYKNYFIGDDQLADYRTMAVGKADNIIHFCQDLPHESIIDVGAGDGAVLNRLDELGFGSRLYAIDISDSGLEAIRAKSWTRLVESKRFDGCTIPYPNDSFDLAILSHVVEHLEHPRMLLHEAARVARHVYIEVPLEVNLSARHLRRDFSFEPSGHMNYFNPDLIRMLVQSCGLRVVKKGTRHFGVSAYMQTGQHFRGRIKHWLKGLTLRISERLATSLFTFPYGIVCTRHGAAPLRTR